MERSSNDNPADAAALDAAQESLRAEQAAWVQEQAEWEEVRRQVETGLADLEARLLEQAKRLRCPRGSEEFEAALNEQLRLAIDRQEAAEQRLRESESRREDLVQQLKDEGYADPNAELVAEVDDLRQAINEAQGDREKQLARIAELEQSASESQGRLEVAEEEVNELRAERDDAARAREEALADLAALSAVTEELAELRRTHEQIQGELTSERERADAREREASDLQSELAELRRVAGDNEEELRQRLEAAEQTTSEEQARSAELADRIAQLEQAEEELGRLKKDQKNSLTSQRDRLQALESELSNWDTDHSEFESRIDTLERENEALVARLAEAESANEAIAALQAAEQAQTAARQAAEESLAETQRQLDQQAAAIATDAAEIERLRHERSELFRELDHNRARTEDVAAAEAEAAALREESCRLEAELQAAQQRLAALESEVSARDAEADDLGALRLDRDNLAEQVELAAEQLAEATVRDAELADLRGKFDLALADLQANREQVATLETELAARPDAEPADDSLLNQLAEERDALLRQLEEATPVVEPSQELEDLRQRFEMAVEDLRELKNENHELNERLANQPAATGADANDWEAQKQRLLAALHDEGETNEPERQAERASIAGTIQITDELIAEKDREIERLRVEAERTTADEHSEALTTALDSDAMILHERERLAKLEVELSEKLRAAELELSVERAKISRTQSAFEEQQLELETLRAARGLAKEAAEGTVPKRRWLDKLGLGGEGQ